MNIIKPKVTKDGLVWLVLPNETAVEAWKSKSATLYVLYNDDSEAMIEADSDIMAAIQNGNQIGIEVGFIKDLLPCCPTCGSKLIPSRNNGYDWECLECDSDGNPIRYGFDEVEILQDKSDEIDWEIRRYEIAKGLMKGFASNSHNQCVDASCETLAQWSVGGANALINELKKNVKK